MYIRTRTGFGDPPPAPAETPSVIRRRAFEREARGVDRPPLLVYSRISGFALNKFTLTPQLKQQVTRVADVVRARLNTARPIGVVRLVGHTDSSGSEGVNVKLGTQRAEAVRDELHAQLRDVLTRVLIYADQTSPGKSQPTADNRTAAGRAANRRVDVYVEGPIPTARPWPEAKKYDWTVRDPNPDKKDPYHLREPIPGPLGGKSVPEFLMDVCRRNGKEGPCKTLVKGAILAGCKAIEALVTQAGAVLSEDQKKEIKRYCEDSANKST